MKTKDIYNPDDIELKWQKYWREKRIYTASDASKKPKKYILVEFPYPSGDLHMGHWYAFAPADTYARFGRMRGFEVLFPIGFDSFGLPAENAAIKRGIDPKTWTNQNIKTMTAQFETMGPSFDWGRVVSTCEPDYYKWTQWIFLQMYKAGLAYRDEVVANWCPECKTVLANEQVEGGKCWRHTETDVIQKKIPQWLFRITAYADKLIWTDETKRGIDWPASVIDGQNKWIGRSEGTEIAFRLQTTDYGKNKTVDGSRKAVDKIRVYTTRADTIYGATFLVLAPEHPFVAGLLQAKSSKLQAKIQEYIEESAKKTELERKEEKVKTGVFTGLYAINTLSKGKIPIWIADYVLSSYGTGSIMAVPAHDSRDFEFAKKYKLEIKQVIKPHDSQLNIQDSAFEGEGTLINSDQFTGLPSQEAIQKITNYLKTSKLGGPKVEYHLHDWTVSRQRYWGAPIPMIHCPNCGIIPVAEKDLPVKLPEKVDYTPRGKSPLASAEGWVKIACPKCGADARRDTDTIDTFVDSSWYFLRYLSPQYKKRFADPKLLKKWMPVDIYFGGPEHTLGHTLYARFVVKVLHDLRHLSFDEFALKRIHHGIILGPDGARMSKSRGNVINPDLEVKKYGADTVRLYLCFMAPHEAGGPWDPSGINGVNRFLKRVWQLFANASDVVLTEAKDAQEVFVATQKTIKKVTEDIEKLKFNTAVSSLMIFTNLLLRKAKAGKKAKGKMRCAEWDEALKTLIFLLAPFAPHIAEELWQRLQQKKTVDSSLKAVSVHLQPWPEYDESLTVSKVVEIPIQVNGKLRGTLSITAERRTDKEFIEAHAKKVKGVSKYTAVGVKKVIFVPGRLINFVV